MRQRPISEDVQSMLSNSNAGSAAQHLLRHLSALDPRRRPPAKVRLEQALGRDLADRLVASLTHHDHR